MKNHLIKIFDNIGFNFISQNDLFVPTNPVKSFNLFNLQHVGYHIPYLCRNIKKNLYETGVGLIKYDNNANIVVERVQVAQSSNENKSVVFTDSDNEFYVFANKRKQETSET